MYEVFFLVALPYIALFVCVAGSIYRYKSKRFSYSSLSSQFLESKKLMWGSMPWHIGIFIIIIGHLIPIFLPGVWQSLTSNGIFLIGVEMLGIIAAFTCFIGLGVLIFRRLTSPKIQAVTSPMDLLILALLMGQILVGISVAAGNRWGAAWSTHTTTPYLWSIFTLQPEMAYIADLPPTVKLHIVMAWLIILMIPFSRLVHMFSFPIAYLWRPPQKVVWTISRRFEQLPAAVQQAQESRRYFIKGAGALAAAGALLTIGVLDKLGRFFRGPEMTLEEESELLQKKLDRLNMAAKERELEIERMKSPYIKIAQLAELGERDGKYFTDYQMRPALAFRNEQGLPILISAKCTHLGCTVGSTLDNDNRLLCPCHISYFDVKSGIPNPGSPAKAPLPRLGWALMDPLGNVVMSQAPDGSTEGAADPAQLNTYSVYISKRFEENA